jgi:hypothetical protein
MVDYSSPYLRMLAGQEIANPGLAQFQGAQAGNALYKISQGREADAISGQAATGDKNALARLYGLDFDRAKGIEETGYQRGRNAKADARAAAAEGRSAEMFKRSTIEWERKTADQRAEDVANVVFNADTPEKFEQAKVLLKARGIDPTNLRFEERQMYIDQATDLASKIKAGQYTPQSPEGKFAADKAHGALPADATQGGGRPPTEAAMRSGALYSVAAPELAIAEQTYSKLSNTSDQVLSKFGVPGNVVNSPDFQRARSAVATIAQSYLYMASGAAAPAEEVKKIVDSVTPVIGDKPGVVADKQARLRTLVNAIRLNAANSPAAGNAPPAGGNVDPLGIR